MMNIFSFLPHATSILGGCQTSYGISDVYQGNILGGVKHTLMGMNLLKLGSSEAAAPMLVKVSLCANSTLVALEGVVNSARGMRNHRLGQAIQGIAQMTFGIAATAAIVSLDSRMIDRARNILTFAGITGWCAWRGLEDFVNGKNREGKAKLLIGLGALAITAYFVYNAYNELNFNAFKGQCESIVQSHQEELKQMMNTKSAVGQWTQIGKGLSKFAFTHPDLPHGIIKIGTDSGRTDYDLQLEYNNILYAKKVVLESQYRYLAIPDSHLISVGEESVLCETKFEFGEGGFYDCSPDARIELHDFLHETRFCDISIWKLRNADFLKGGCNIGLYDFDCRHNLRGNFD